MSKKQYYCDYGIISSRNGVVCLLCTKSGNACSYQRYCTNDQCIKHTNDFVKCALWKGEDTQMARKNNKRKTTTQVTVNTVKNTNENITQDVGEDMRASKRCKVILVADHYFIVDNSGYALRIQGKTDLKRGDWYILNNITEEKQKVQETVKEESQPMQVEENNAEEETEVVENTEEENLEILVEKIEEE